MLVGLDDVEVRAFALREAVLAVELKLGSDNGVFAPAVHVKGSLSKHKGAGIGNTGATHIVRGIREGDLSTGANLPVVGSIDLIRSTRHGEKARGVDVLVGTSGINLARAAIRVERGGKGIDGIRVVERLGSKSAEKHRGRVKGSAVVNVGVGLDNPDKLFARVVEVELDLVGRGADGLVTRELELLNKVLVGVLGHLAALIRIEEDVVDVEGGSNKGLLVSSGGANSAGSRGKAGNGPEALSNRTEVNVNLDLVVLEGDKGKGKAGVAAEPELEGDVKSGLRKGIARSANLGRATSGSARARDGGKGGVADVRKMSCVTNHLPVATALLIGHSKLVPDVHPVAILTVDALATNLDLNLSNDLLANEAEPTSPDASATGTVHVLVNLRENKLEVGAVAQIAVAADCAGHATAKIGLARESLLNRLHGKVGMAAVRHLPESNLGGTRKEHVLGTVSDKLHKSSTHGATLLYTMLRK